MREQVKKALEDLTAAIQSGDAYKNYRNMCKILGKQPEKADKLNKFREKRYFVCREPDGGFEKTEELFQLEQEIKKDRECREFLSWENEFCQEIRKITEEILNLAELSIPMEKEGEDGNGFT